MPTSDDNDYRQRLINFFSILHQKLQNYREMKRYMDRFLSTDFNVFNRIEPDENALSDIIADMLDPAGSHGQQRMFLDAFLRILDSNVSFSTPFSGFCEVRREAFYTNGNDSGKIDILVTFDSGFRIGIENKLEEGDDRDQLLRYLNYLNRVSNGKFRLIYLTPDGGAKPIDDKRLLPMSYRSEILKWLRKGVQLCESDKFRWFLRDFMDYIPTMMEGRQMTGEEKVIVEHALDSKENLKMTLDICFIFDELRKQIITREFQTKLKECLKEHLDGSEEEWEYKGGFVDKGGIPENDAYYGFFGFGKRSWETDGIGYRIGIERQGKNGGGTIIYGVRRNRELGEDEYGCGLKEAIDEAIAHKTGPGKSSRWWEWYIKWEEDYGNWDKKEALINIRCEEAIKEIVNRLILIKDAVEKKFSSNGEDGRSLDAIHDVVLFPYRTVPNVQFLSPDLSGRTKSFSNILYGAAANPARL